MSPRNRLLALAGTLAALGLFYVVAFTDWIRPEPIGISSQVRSSILKPNFGRAPKPVLVTNTTADGSTYVLAKTNAATDPGTQARRVRLPYWGEIDQGPGGAANVTFSLDDAYPLTSVRVVDVPADGSTPKVLWEATGQSRPVRSILYGRVPEGMRPVPAGATPQPRTPGAPYPILLESGRRRGTHAFRTVPAAP